MRSFTPFDMPDMDAELRALLTQVPPGRATTYGRLAEALGSPAATKWVGHWALHHAHDAQCPCHRIVRTDGRLGNHIVGIEAKAALLRAEGVAVVGDRIDLAHCGWSEFTGTRPLERLRALQEKLRPRVELFDLPSWPQLAAGVDVSYVDDRQGVAAYALVEVATGRLLWSTTIRAAAPFPYISTFLTFRELPLLLDVLAAAQAAESDIGRAEVVLVDGTGILHPRRMGIAAHLGIATGRPTIGVTKTLLCGRVEWDSKTPLPSREGQGEGSATRGSRRGWGAPRPITDAGGTIGCAVLPTRKARVPLYVSPGHRVTVEFAGRLVEQLLHGHRLPEPLYWADRLSRVEARRVK
jgi:deoxyribonuclease V